MAAPRLFQPDGIDDLLLYRLARLLGVAGSMVIRLCEGRFGITRREWRVLAQLARNEGLLSSELADRVQLDRARTSRAVTSLVGKKLVSRETGEADRRQARLRLTAAGRRLYGEMFPQVQAINRDLLSAVPRADLTRLDGALAAMQLQADAMVAHADLPKADRRRGGRMRLPMG